MSWKNPYPKYKPTSIDWIGDIPEHWSVKKIKYLFRIKKDIAGKLGFDVLSITQKGIKIKDIESGEGQLAMDYSKYQSVKKGDFAMNHMDLLTGYVDISKYDGVISPDYRVFVLTHKESNPRYYLYLLQFCYTSRIFFNYGQGSSQLGRWRLAADEFNNFFFPCPSQDEQTQIANFLDHKCRLIDKFLDKKQQLINTLKEQKQAIINQAVTKGINPNVEMKDSGVEWLGIIPKHWEVKKLKYLLKDRLKYGANESGEHYNEGYVRYIRITDFGIDGNLRGDSELYLPAKVANNYLLKKGDILFARSGATVGKTYQFSGFETNCCFAGYLIKATPNKNIILSDFLSFYTYSGIYEEWKSLIFNKATIENIGADKYSNLFVPVPSVSEQQEILAHLEKETSQIDQAISRIEKEMELTKDYRQILISEAVTGKIDVRNWLGDSKTANDTINIAAEPNGKYSVASE